MEGLSFAQLLFYGGIFCMGLAVFLAVIGIFVFRHTGKKIKRELDELYGDI